MGAGPNLLRDNQLHLFQKSQVTPVTSATRTNDANEKPFRIVGCIILHVDVGRLTEILTFLGCERLTAPAMFGCEF